MAAKLEAEGFAVELVPGSAGIFDVHADDQLVYSKHSEGRFPDPEEVLTRLRRS